MTLPINEISSRLIYELVIWSVRSLVLAVIAGAGLAILRVRTTSLRLFVWSFVLYGSVALPVLGWLLPPVSIPASELLKRQIVRIERESSNSRDVALPASQMANSNLRSSQISVSTPPLHTAASVDGTAGSQRSVEHSRLVLSSLRWKEIAAGVYLLVAALFLIRLAIGIVLSCKLVRNAAPITDASATIKLACHRGLIPRLAMSDWISVPVTVGTLRPTILLPTDWRTWEDAKLSAVLAHELSHIVRRDPLTQRIALLFRAIFWFNPLAWWLNRHLAALAEQASDEAALSDGADQNQYARTLLSFFESLQAAPGRIWWQGVSMAKHGQAEQRLERILAWKGTATMNLKKSIAVTIFFLAVPVVYLAASLRPTSVAMAASPVMTAQSVPPATAPVSGVSTAAPVDGVVAPARVPGVASAGPVTAVTPELPASGSGQSYSSGTAGGFAYGFDDEERFVIVSGKSDAFTMSGSQQDARHVEKLKKQIPGGFIWFQRDEKSYIIRDQATIDRARALWTPQEELGKKQEALGKQQEELGKQQEAVGTRMQQVRVKVPDMTGELDKLRAKLQKLGPTATMEQMGEIQSEIGELQSKIGEIQSEAGEQQSKVGDLQGELGEKQGKLGELQGELGRQQAELAEKATRKMKELLDEALKNGTAKPEPESGGGSML